jgi:6,7-dimethyl-8-ribityllumazine synthase
MPTKLEGDLLARDARIAIVVSRFNDYFTKQLVEGATDIYRRLGGNSDSLTIVHVPGRSSCPWPRSSSRSRGSTPRWCAWAA